jgi:hypothetical protein
VANHRFQTQKNAQNFEIVKDSKSAGDADTANSSSGNRLGSANGSTVITVLAKCQNSILPLSPAEDPGALTTAEAAVLKH